MRSNPNPETTGSAQSDLASATLPATVIEPQPRKTVSRRMVAGISAGTLLVGLLVGGGTGVALGTTLAPAVTSTAVTQDQTGFPGTPPDMGTGTPPDMGTGTPPDVGFNSDSGSTTDSSAAGSDTTTTS